MNPSVRSVLLLPGAFQPIHYCPGYSAQPAKHGCGVITHRRDNTMIVFMAVYYFISTSQNATIFENVTFFSSETLRSGLIGIS